jgi:hypothetical protein
MKPTSIQLLLVSALLLGFSATPQQGSRATTPGKAEVAAHPLVLDPPARPETKKIDAAKTRAEADELAKAAATIPNDIEQVTQGKLPKDLNDKLKRIEKLSKNLRGEITP